MRVVFGILLGLLPFAAHASSPEFSCYQAIVGYTAGPFESDLSGNLGYGSVLFQGALPAAERSTDDGLYLLMDHSACFYRFPSATAPNRESYFPMKLSIPNQSPTYVAFQVEPDQYPNLVWSPNALPGVSYSAAACEATDSAAGQQGIHDFLGAKIRAVTTRYGVNLAGCRTTGHCQPKRDFVEALNACPVSGLKPVIDQAIAELKKLPECGCPK